MNEARQQAEDMAGIYSDCFKSAHGSRPRGILMDNFLNASIEEQDAMFKLLRIIEEENELTYYDYCYGMSYEEQEKQEQEREQAAAIKIMLQNGAANEEQALRWIAQAA